MQPIITFFKKHEKIAVTLLVVIFVLLRFPSVDRPLHQDEYKWPLIVNPANEGVGIVPHPPLSEFIYRTAGEIVGYDVDFRYVPLFFGALNLVLLYYFMRMSCGKREALLASVLWIVSYFSILASLMVDTDGEILPFFFLLALIAYHKLLHVRNGVKRKWWVLLVFSALAGIMVKLSFVLAIGAIIADFLWSHKYRLSRTEVVRYGSYALGAVGVLALLMLAAPYIFPFFHLSESFAYWKHFFNEDRGWLQILIQCMKALLYMSPLIFIPFLAPKHTLRPLRPLLFFLGFAFVFYIVLFDFSAAALDRYLQLLILPIVAFSAVTLRVIFNDEIEKPSETTKVFLLSGCAIALALSLVQFFPHYIPPLHPKMDWIHRALTLRWDFVFPFHGGSGPLGFYVSFLFMGLSWIVTALLAFLAWHKPKLQKRFLALLIPVALMYNAVFIEEYHFGIVNGSAPKLLKGAVEYIKNNPDIEKVAVYNDNGGDDIQRIGKYLRRLYIDPKFGTDKKLKLMTDYYFELNTPLPPEGAYRDYVSACNVIYQKRDQKITATVYDCRNVVRGEE